MFIEKLEQKLKKDLKMNKSMYPKSEEANINSRMFVGSRISYIEELLQWVIEHKTEKQNE